jgi:hypothetical protein
MNRLTTALLTTALLLGCTTMVRNTTDEVVTEFADLEQWVGSSIRVEGIVSQTHGAAGLYLTVRDLREENARCILPQPFDGLAHGERVTLSGVLERTDCGKGLICMNACDQYVLHQKPFARP